MLHCNIINLEGPQFYRGHVFGGVCLLKQKFRSCVFLHGSSSMTLDYYLSSLSFSSRFSSCLGCGPCYSMASSCSINLLCGFLLAFSRSKFRSFLFLTPLPNERDDRMETASPIRLSASCFFTANDTPTTDLSRTAAGGQSEF